MADDVDMTQDRIEREMELILGARKPAAPGRDDCRKCGELITPLRRDLGATLRIDCQADAELTERTTGHRPGQGARGARVR